MLWVVVCSLHKLVNADLGIRIADQLLVFDRNRTSPQSFLSLSSKKGTMVPLFLIQMKHLPSTTQFSSGPKYRNSFIFPLNICPSPQQLQSSQRLCGIQLSHGQKVGQILDTGDRNSMCLETTTEVSWKYPLVMSK